MKLKLLGLLAMAMGAFAGEYDVTKYGAKPDGTTDNTPAIQKAIDECSAKGGGRVLVPGGGVYKTYMLNLGRASHMGRRSGRRPGCAHRRILM